MAGPGLPTNIVSGGTTGGHKTHSDTVHTYINKFDSTSLTPNDTDVLSYDATAGTYKPDARLTALALTDRNAQTGTTYTATASDANKIIERDNSSFNTITLPSLPAKTAFGILQYGAGQTMINAGSGVTLRSRDGATAMAGRYSLATAYYRTSTEVVLGGDLLAISPLDVASLSLWYKAADLAALTDGTAINGNWSSAVGTSTATQGTSGARPTKQTVSGKPVVRFDGTDDKLVIDGDALTCTQNVAGVTMFARMKLLAAPGGGAGGIVGFSVNGSTVNGRARLRAENSNWEVTGRRLDADGSSSAGTTAYETTSVHTICGVIDFASSDAFVFVDGVAAGSNTSFGTSGNTSDTVSSSARIGARTDDNHPINMDLYEVVVCSAALSVSERTLIEAYLSAT